MLMLFYAGYSLNQRYAILESNSYRNHTQVVYVHFVFIKIKLPKFRLTMVLVLIME